MFKLTRDDMERRREDMSLIRQGQEDPDRADKIVVCQARKAFVLTRSEGDMGYDRVCANGWTIQGVLMDLI